MEKYLKLARNQTGTILIFTTGVLGLLIGYFETNTKPEILKFILFLLGAFFVRTSGCIINDIFDKDFDIKVERTKNRPIATGEISIKKALVITFILLTFALLIMLSFPVKSYFMFILALISIMVYPLFKRFTYFPQVMLGVSFAFGLIASYLVVVKIFNFKIIFPAISIILWTVIYDTIYAMQDIKDDIKIGIKSTTIKFGTHYKIILHFINIFYLIFLLIFWHLSNLKFVLFPVLSFVLLALLIAKAGEKSFFISFMLSPLACFLISIGILLNL